MVTDDDIETVEETPVIKRRLITKQVGSAPSLTIVQLQEKRSLLESKMHEERMEFDREKFVWEQEQARLAYEARMAEVESKKDIRKTELEYEFRLAQMQLASKERIRMAEIQQQREDEYN